MKQQGDPIRLLFLFLSVGILMSCTPVEEPPPTIQSPPASTPTTVLEPATEFQVGQCEKPEDTYLFLKVSSHMACSPACDCPEIEATQPAIHRSGETIYYNFDQVVGSFKSWDSEDPAISLAIKGWFEDSLVVIHEFPFELAGTKFHLLGCSPSGTAIIEIDTQTYYLDPDEVWSSQSVVDEGDGCYFTHTLSFRNEGLIKKEHFFRILV
jgi:hypothetical protein